MFLTQRRQKKETGQPLCLERVKIGDEGRPWSPCLLGGRTRELRRVEGLLLLR